jgi:signal transduction histidine kinase
MNAKSGSDVRSFLTQVAALRRSEPDTVLKLLKERNIKKPEATTSECIEAELVSALANASLTRYELALHHSTLALALVDSTVEQALIARLHSIRGDILWQLGHYSEAHGQLVRGLLHADAAGDLQQIICLMLLQAIVMATLGDFDTAIAVGREVRSLALSQRDAVSATIALANMADHRQTAAEIAELEGDETLRRSLAQAALADAEQAYREAQTHQDSLMCLDVVDVGVRACYALADAETVSIWWQRAEAHAHEKPLSTQDEWTCIRAAVLATQGRFEEAYALLKPAQSADAVAPTRRQLRFRKIYFFAEACRRSGRLAEALDAQRSLTRFVFADSKMFGKEQTRLLRAEQLQLREDTFTFLAHDLRASLGNLALLSQSPSAAPAEQLRQIHGLAREALGMCEQYVERSRLERITPTQFECIDTGQLLADACSQVTGQAAKRSVALRPLTQADLCVSGHRHSLLRAFVNLLDNAIRLTPAGGVVTVGNHQTGSDVCLYVQDQGPGMPAAAQALLKRSAETQALSSTDRLGLSSVARVLRVHGTQAEIAVAANGTCVSVQLPLVPVEGLDPPAC